MTVTTGRGKSRRSISSAK